MLHKAVLSRWTDCIVAATGPSLTPEAAAVCAGRNVIAVNDAYRLIPDAQVLYACDEKWWDVHCPDFRGEKWSSHGRKGHNDKLACAERHGLNLVHGEQSEGFSLNPSKIHYGSNSGFQAINLAILFGCKRIVLIGFDMQVVAGKRHFFGDHPRPLSNQSPFKQWVPLFERAAKKLPHDIQILNATPNSALTCFTFVDLADALPIAA